MFKDPTKRFSDRVENYVKYRPSYPKEIISKLQNEGILTKNSVVADIGSGTGIFSKVLLDADYQVISVEPNNEMREFAENYLVKYAKYRSVAAQAENTNLEDNSVDVITVAQAFHWFEREKTRNEFLRILKPDGSLVIIWNNRLKDKIPFPKAYNDLLIKYCPEHEVSNHYKITFDQIADFYGSSKVKYFTCDNYQMLDFNSLKGRLLSSSYVPLENDPNYLPLISDLKVIFDKYQIDNQVKFEYLTMMYYGQMFSEAEK
ncbi:MAG: class I SAM-dependent methyltransferase [Asgard group archaeon]|nr:class I SAM-dependent methyltransferase [Asgard group archaeon]